MINAMIEAISAVLGDEFDEKTYEIYLEEAKQELIKPCFFISCLNSTHQLILGKKYFRQNQFLIRYIPESEDIQKECNATAERMNWCLEYITVNGDTFQGTKMRCEIIDGVLNFYVNYDGFVYKVETETAMETIEESIDVKGGD